MPASRRMSASNAPAKYNLIALRRRMNIARCSGGSASASTRAQAPVSMPRTLHAGRLVGRTRPNPRRLRHTGLLRLRSKLAIHLN